MTDASDNLPLRQVTRLRAEMVAQSAERMTRVFGNDAVLAIEFGLLARLCLPDWVREEKIVRPETVTRTITMRQVAASLNAAPETTRRRLAKLRDRGLVEISDQGVTLARSVESEAVVRDYCLGVHDLFIQLIEDIAATCDVAFPVGATPGFGIAEVIERAIDTLLAPIDTYRPAIAPMAFFVWGALTSIAVRRVTYDSALARRFARTIPTDNVRDSVALRPLAQSLGIPYATAWRQVQALIEAGLVTRLANGRLTVLTANLLEHSVRDISDPPSRFALRHVRELALMGLDPARAAEYYRVGRRPLADLGIADRG